MKERPKIPPHCDGYVSLRNSTSPLQVRKHRHDELEICMVLNGTGQYLLNDRSYELQPYSMVVLFPSQEHLLLDRSDDYEMWLAVFGRDLLGRTCRMSGSTVLLERDPAGAFCKRLTPLQFQRLGDLCRELDAIHDEPDRFNAGLGYLLMECWQAYCDAENVLAGVALHPAVRKALRILADSTGPDMLEDIAGAAGLSVSRLSRVFKQQVGLSMVAFRNRQRVERFLRIHRAGSQRTMIADALDAGFGSYAQFHRIFRQTTGKNPAAYFKRQKG
ncbi:MAG: AraC family transcriptional regulator [Phycisphaerae bacterium]|nr:AraC family transcriptional regulator [Phycisphaerae bacterium]